MKKKRICGKRAAALFAAACIAGNMPCAQMCIYAAETGPAAAAEKAGQADKSQDSAAAVKNAETVSGAAIQIEDEGRGTGNVQEVPDGSGAVSGDETDGGIYTDQNGVSYYYNICGDGTADIYDIKDYTGKYIDIPADMDGHTVTRLTCRMQFGNVEGLTVPETVTYVEGAAFANMEIGLLRYNAQSASTVDSTERTAPFSRSKIGTFLVGGDVADIPKRMFSYAAFQQDELVIHTPKICEDAFWSAEFQKLTIGEEVKDIGIHAFSFSDVGELCWNAADIETYGEEGVGRNAPFAYAAIHDISIGDAAASIPACFVNGATELSVSRLEIPSTVTSIGSRAFYDPYEGSYTVGSLYIGENVSYLGANAFDGCKIGILEYNAADAATDGPDGNGPFEDSHVGELRIGTDVTVLPAKIFCGMALVQEELEISGGIVSVEDKAICSGNGNEIRIGTLTVGEHVAHMGMYALSVDSIGTLKYNAQDAGTNGEQGPLDSPFYNTAVGELQIGAGVRKIPASVFAGMELEQDVLEFPAGVASIGARAFQQGSWHDISFGTVEIGENITSIGRGAFGSCSIGKAHVCTLESDWASKDMAVMGYEKPSCTAVEIHGGSDYYSYFTSKTDQENITLLCSDFESSRGEEYYDAEKGCFVVPVTETCTVCGYQKLGGEYADAHTVIFADYDGTEISRQAVHDGGDAAPPEDPQRTGWCFTGWDKEYTGVTADLTVTAQYEICRFTVAFMDGETVLSSQEVEYGGDASLPENPSRPDEAWGKWKFTGWNGNYTGISKDETVSAVFEKTLNEYEVSFYDADGNIIDTQTVKHGGKAEAPQAPEKAADAQHRYLFTGWDGSTENITSDTSFHPVYKTETNTYTVTFMDGETVLSSQEVNYGDSAEAPENPTRPDEAWGKWHFTGWKGSYKNITKDETVYAMFEKVLNKYQVIFYDAEGNVLSAQTVKHGEKAEAPQAPEKAADSQYTYVFKGWDADTENITSDTSFHPVYEAKSQGSSGTDENAGTYQVIFMDGSTVLSVQKVKAGKDASAPADPARPDEAWGKWRFSGWKGSYKNITKDETVYAMFEKVLNEYQVIFYDADGNALSTQTVKHGGAVKAPQAPGKAADSRYTYVFIGWDADMKNIMSDTSFHPVYETRTRTYTVTFMNGKKVLSEQEVGYGDSAAAPPDPVKKADGSYIYRFAGWDADFSFITKNITVHALFDKEKNSGAGSTDTEENGTGGQDKDKDKRPDKDTNKDKNTDKDEDADKNKNTDKDKGSSKDKDTGKDKKKNKDEGKGGSVSKKTGNRDTGGKETGENGAGTDRKDGKTESGNGKGGPAGIGAGTGSGTGLGQPVTGGKKQTAGNTLPVQKPDTADARPALPSSGGEKAAGQNESGTGKDRKPKTIDKAEEQEKTEERKTADESSGGTATMTDDGSRADDAGKGWKQPGRYGFLFFFITGAASVTALCAWLYLQVFRKYRIRGTVLDADGNPVCGVHVLLTGEDMPETCTDRNGAFCFDALKKGIRQLEISRSGERTLLSMNVCVGGRDIEEAFQISSSHCLSVSHMQEKNDYVVGVRL